MQRRCCYALCLLTRLNMLGRLRQSRPPRTIFAIDLSLTPARPRYHKSLQKDRTGQLLQNTLLGNPELSHSCTIRRISKNFIMPPLKSSGWTCLRICIVMTVLASTAVVLRLIARYRTKLSYAAEDWLIIAALLIFGTYNGTLLECELCLTLSANLKTEFERCDQRRREPQRSRVNISPGLTRTQGFILLKHAPCKPALNRCGRMYMCARSSLVVRLLPSKSPCFVSIVQYLQFHNFSRRPLQSVSFASCGSS